MKIHLTFLNPVLGCSQVTGGGIGSSIRRLLYALNHHFFGGILDVGNTNPTIWQTCWRW
tara:strand:- start:237 stop:413 length:177 start_codon:yes stop_codon:yes gene_type:complete